MLIISPAFTLLLSSDLEQQLLCTATRPPLLLHRTQERAALRWRRCSALAQELPSKQNHNSFNLISLK